MLNQDTLNLQAQERLYKFGDPADLAHYKESVSGICSKSSEKDHLKASLPEHDPVVTFLCCV